MEASRGLATRAMGCALTGAALTIAAFAAPSVGQGPAPPTPPDGPDTSTYPRNSKAPSIRGAEPRQDGQLLKGDDGTWEEPPRPPGPPSGAPSPPSDPSAERDPTTVRYTREWLRCDGAGGACAVSGSGSDYALTAADVGKRIRYRVTGECGVPEVCKPNTVASRLTGVVLPDPNLEAQPEITGEAREGQVLSGSIGFWRSPVALSFVQAWFRCDGAGNACAHIGGATGPEHRLTSEDVGSTIRFGVLARNARPRERVAVSAATPPVVGQAASPPRPPATRPRLISPFPRVVIAGVLTRSGVSLKEFSIAAPRGSLVRIACRGRGCPFRRKRMRVRSRRVRVRALQRRLRAGVVLRVRVTRRGYVGKYTRVRIRRGRVPARADRCLRPGARRPSRCPRRR